MKDLSHGATALLTILTYDDIRDGNLFYKRPMWQDSAGAAAGAAILADLTPDGSVLTRYAARPCGSGNCVANPPATTDQSQYKAVDYKFNGLSRVNDVITYRCPQADDAQDGCPAGIQATRTRRETFASAKIDNYSDPLAAGRLAWLADADQVFASLKDSGSANADLYRTEYVYDGSGQVSETIEVRQVDVSTYYDTVKLYSSTNLKAYWRLGEASGNFTDSSGNTKTGTASQIVLYGQPGALIRDSNKAPTLNGTNSKITASVAMPSSAYTIEAWVKSSEDDQVSTGLAGRFNNDTGAKLYLKSTGAFGFQHTDDLASSGIVPEKGRWYHVVGTWDGGRARLYVDGALAARRSDIRSARHGQFQLRDRHGLQRLVGFFAGSFDDVAVYSVALTAAEISAHYRAGRASRPSIRRSSETTPVDRSRRRPRSSPIRGSSRQASAGHSTPAPTPRLPSLIRERGPSISQPA